MIRNLQSLGKTILLTTHYMDEAEHLADRAAIIVDGEIVAEGTPGELSQRDGSVTIGFGIDSGSGALPGDDWTAAETRWFDNGITRDDFLSMSDDRLPFDAKIGETGFPTTISMLPVLIVHPRNRAKLGDVLDIFDNLSPGKTRSFVATTINWLFLVHSLGELADQESTFPNIDYQTLESIYREVPPGSFIPLPMIVNLIGDSIQRVAEFMEAFKDKNFVLHSEGASRNRGGECVTVLRRAYMGLDEDALLLPVLGVLPKTGTSKANMWISRIRNPWKLWKKGWQLLSSTCVKKNGKLTPVNN